MTSVADDVSTKNAMANSKQQSMNTYKQVADVCDSFIVFFLLTGSTQVEHHGASSYAAPTLAKTAVIPGAKPLPPKQSMLVQDEPGKRSCYFCNSM